MLKQRVLTALVALPILLAAVWFNEPVPWFTVFLAAWAAVAAYEFFRLAGTAKARPLMPFGIVVAVSLVAVRERAIVSSLNLSYEELSYILLTAAIIFPLVWLLWREPKSEAFTRWAWTIAGIGYVGFLLGHLAALRGLDGGRTWVLFALLCTFASDTAAFFFGRRFGKHKLAPKISPSKSWEGAVAGVAGAGLASLLFLPVSFFGWANPLHLVEMGAGVVALGVVVSVAGQLGDLVESLFKRNMGAKDSGGILPGHGGALDRMDSVAFAGVVVYYFVWLLR